MKLTILWFLLYLHFGYACAQQLQCGRSDLISQINLKIGRQYVTNVIQSQYAFIHSTQQHHYAGKETSGRRIIPLIFHIILSAQQLGQIGGTQALEDRIDDQVAAINRDFNADAFCNSGMPTGFAALKADVGLSFALAHVSPKNVWTPGYELLVTDEKGFNENAAIYSGVGFSEVKHAQTGGLDAWDNDCYLNIWVVNPLENGAQSNITGETIPPSFVADKALMIPVAECGIVLHYLAFGIQASTNQPFLTGKNLGKTLTHELGHFFELWHTWGDDNGKCPGEGGIDDGIDDTPPEAGALFGMPSYPKFDHCTTSGDGLMFMNYMDYTDDTSKCMFSMGQASVINACLQFGGESYVLTQHAQLTMTALQPEANTCFVGPNPATDALAVIFKRIPVGLRSLALYDVAGNVIQKETEAKSFYQFKLSAIGSGCYFLHIDFSDHTEYRKIDVVK